MVTLQKTDTIDMQDFAYLWRITDARWDKLPTDSISRIYPLNKEYSKYIYNKVLEASYIASEEFRIAKVIDTESIYKDNAHIVCDWLSDIPIPKNERVYVCWSDDVALVTEWEVFIKSWDALWYPFDIVQVFDDTLNWIVKFGMEETIVYLERIL